jgi:hypothetical protein
MPLIPAPRCLGQEVHRLESGLGYMLVPYLTKIKEKERKFSRASLGGKTLACAHWKITISNSKDPCENSFI